MRVLRVLRVVWVLWVMRVLRVMRAIAEGCGDRSPGADHGAALRR
jgi:hypothetical protein